MSGKGSKQRPTDHAKFSANFDAIFSKRPTYHCDKCGEIDSDGFWEEREVNHEPYGDQSVERVEIYMYCNECDGEVEEI